ncbi:uncharacterized protein B0J16DRAFT_388430 [Fusarium flagelliforme]|uniref:Amine oxidase (Flavin-containing) n=1 Tax=Fusarium flagelliforme TaxID=2675880 RepID=A0A395MKC6_9HYPO|nr:uncharacterized protein B0J16DRAFT_388430 [Fusarium flagelliforme]KAH7174608.1 hypothetical protein B0J16DRAFT_388430 [Fusarium flagelliforme]RFN48356.1 amine oxidase (flavin-containing) [Fusarium flagelliforme]
MPPRGAQNKRPATDAEDNQPASKSARTGNAEEQGETTQTPRGSCQRRILKGPKGESMMPQFMPRECAEANVIENLPMPSRWVIWEDHGPWLEAHKAGLKLSAAKWKMREEAMKQDGTVPDDEGNDDWDFICLPIPPSERNEEDEELVDSSLVDEEEEGGDKDKDGE